MTENNEKIWKKFLCKHWKMFALFLIGALIAILGAILIFLWFVGDAQSTGLVPELLGSWSMGYLVTFLLHLIFWEIVYIAIPVLIALAAIYFLWWKRLPEEERKEYKEKHLFGKSSKSKDGGKAITFMINVFFVLKIYMDGNWGKPFATWKFDYLVNSYLIALLWVALIFGIPIGIGAIWWITHMVKKESD